jgi:hypothetical protein
MRELARVQDGIFRGVAPTGAVVAVLRRMPHLAGASITLETARGLRDRRGPVHAGSLLRERRIVFDCTRAEFPRIFAHEAAHFLWLRLGNTVRRAFEELLRSEIAAKVRGELGWSAEWRKDGLRAADLAERTRKWREYCCESFCDTAAWLYSGVRRHEEFTLPARARLIRRGWFADTLGRRVLSI